MKDKAHKLIIASQLADNPFTLIMQRAGLEKTAVERLKEGPELSN